MSDWKSAQRLSPRASERDLSHCGRGHGVIGGAQVATVDGGGQGGDGLARASEKTSLTTSTMAGSLASRNCSAARTQERLRFGLWGRWANSCDGRTARV